LALVSAKLIEFSESIDSENLLIGGLS